MTVGIAHWDKAIYGSKEDWMVRMCDALKTVAEEQREAKTCSLLHGWE